MAQQTYHIGDTNKMVTAEEFNSNDMLKHILIIKTRGNFSWRLWFLISAPIIWLFKGKIEIK